ncbi:MULTISPECIES: hypothetical protein [Marinomonas]|uniref:hypothetical protein n=1 Tax=Marinomonas TaxID=28253 RepID=UPI000DBA78C6|nr:MULTISPECIES: hypothetical protein [Marinomonas]GGN35694.1 hypothetical protein GCM10011350_33270 [Marinomonas arctica]
MSKIDVLVVWPNRPEQMQILADTYELHRYDQASVEEKAAMIDAVGDKIRAVAKDVDVLAPVIPGGPATEGLISREVLSALGENSYFINVLMKKR